MVFQTPPLAPAPAADEIAQLVTQAREAGMRVRYTMEGAARPLPGGLSLAAYRIVQEALTNVVKHAATDSARVTVEHRPDAIVLDIVDRGRGGAVLQEAHGLTGMRERAALYGGTLLVGPMPDGGFKVSATLPLPADGAS